MLRALFEQMVGVVSPYAANPLNYNPFRSLVEDFFDFDAIRKSDGCKLFLAATHVQTGKIRIFHNREISADALMATSCVPTMFQAVEVDGEYYWDGGYVANPAIFPLIGECDAVDIVLVQLTSSRAPRLPRHAAEIGDSDGLRVRLLQARLSDARVALQHEHSGPSVRLADEGVNGGELRLSADDLGQHLLSGS